MVTERAFTCQEEWIRSGTTLEGWQRYKNHPDRRIRERFNWEVRWLRRASSALLWTMEQRLKNTNQTVSAQIRALSQDIGRDFGPVSRLASRLLGPFLLRTTKREERRLARGVAYEPATIMERHNWPSAQAASGMERILQGGGVPHAIPSGRAAIPIRAARASARNAD